MKKTILKFLCGTMLTSSLIALHVDFINPGLPNIAVPGAEISGFVVVSRTPNTSFCEKFVVEPGLKMICLAIPDEFEYFVHYLELKKKRNRDQ